MVVRIILEVDGTSRRARRVPEEVVPRLRTAVEKEMGRQAEEGDVDLFMRFLHRACTVVIKDMEARTLYDDARSNFVDPIEDDEP